jgi:lactaldehyde dehydrogenase/glycolaldehyde dehydrogenase
MSARKENKNGVDHYRMYINGAWVESSSGEVIEVENPTNEEIMAAVQKGNAEDGKRALESARDAQPAWAAVPAVERGNMLLRLTEKLREEREYFARLLTLEQGKTYDLALGEVDATIDYISFPAQCARRIEGDICPSDVRDEHIWIHRVPYGVTVALAAWNFPLALAGRKFGPSLAAGNTMVVKPPSITPVAVVELGRLIDEVGLPPGVLNIVTGGGSSIGTELVSNPITRLVTMTGSVQTGRQLYRLAADHITEIRLELGGKAPFIVMEDANLDKAVEAAIVSRFLNCGQVCTCNERMYIHDAVYDEFMSRFVAGSATLKVGDPLESDTGMGPKVCREEVENVEAMVQRAIDDGCKVETGGRRPTGGIFEKGHWYEPTVLSGATNDMAIMRDEIFGPVAPVARVGSFDEALRLANDSDFGLAGYLFTNDMRRIHRAVQELDIGEIYVNRPIGEQRQGFHNGFKLSGTGGEDGKHGFENYLQKKTFYVNYG